MREQPKQLKCGSCLDTVFQTSADFREHFKSAWHRYNLARKMNVSWIEAGGSGTE